MSAIALTTTARVDVVESFVQATLPAAEAITAGDAVRIDTSTGKFTKANGTSAGEARIYGVAVRSVAAGFPVTAIRKGVMDGYDLSGMNYDAAVYLSDTDGSLDTAAGTASVVVGRVIPGTSEALGTSYSKLLFVDL